ncbi:MAG: hypothetical protein M2R45_03550 [Verrucomicrobia subdivision 3 bacterium]|nr:hypothetical protein [Limisphaerales bacterium]MCS1416473.1 hypothetical protein [Limisphaerales bacterium]
MMRLMLPKNAASLHCLSAFSSFTTVARREAEQRWLLLGGLHCLSAFSSFTTTSLTCDGLSYELGVFIAFRHLVHSRHGLASPLSHSQRNQVFIAFRHLVHSRQKGESYER